MSNHIGRNSPCPCGSGKKYKKCCLSFESLQPKVRTLASLGTLTKLDGTNPAQTDCALTNHPITDRDIVFEVTQGVTNLLSDDSLGTMLKIYGAAFREGPEITEVFTRLTTPSDDEGVEFALLRPQAEGFRPVIVCTIDEARALLPNFDEVYNGSQYGDGSGRELLKKVL